MNSNPYAWDSDEPRHHVHRTVGLDEIERHVRRGRAVKVIGGRGMGKSVLLHQAQARLMAQAGTRVVLVPGPPEERTLAGAVRDLAVHLGVRDLATPRLDDLLESVLTGQIQRLIVLFDEADQYVALGGEAEIAFTRSWFNRLEVARKRHHAMFDLVFAGGLGLLYLEREIGSGIVSRAEPCVLTPFSLEEIGRLTEPFSHDGRPLDERFLKTLLAFSGGNPALATYGLERLWEVPTPTARDLERTFGIFRERHASFLRAVRSSVSQHGRLDAPWRVLEVVRANAGCVPLAHLRQACVLGEGENVIIDLEQALDLLCAAGLVRIEGSVLADPVVAWPVLSILNLPAAASGPRNADERLVQNVCAVLRDIRRFGRDFHDGDGLIAEEVLSSIIAVGLLQQGWLETDREAVQAAGFTDIKVRFRRPDLDGHAIIETKIWTQVAHNQGIQAQVDDYRMADTRRGIAITLGVRGIDGWPERYEEVCLTGRDFRRLETPPDLVGHWRVRQTHPGGGEWITDHLLVQIPKRR